MPNKHGKATENEIQSTIRDYLHLRGWYVMRMQQGLGSLRGMSDLIALKDGRTVYIEVKTAKGKQSEPQKLFQANIEGHGGEYFVMCDLADAVKMDGG